MAPDAHSQETHPLSSLDEFPPTVVQSKEFSDGAVDLYLLDEGTEEEPRFIRTYPDSTPADRVNV